MATLSLGFLKKAVEKMREDGKSEDDIKKFQSGVQGYFTKKLAPNFKDLDCYTGESMDPDGMYVDKSSFHILTIDSC